MTETEPVPTPALSRRRIWLRRGGLLLLLATVLQNIPGTYTFKDVRAEVDASSPEGVALLGMDGLTLSATLEFDRATLQRVSRNAQLSVPSGATLNISAESRPHLDPENGTVVLQPENVLLVSDKPLTFIYRNVPLAHSRELATGPDGLLRVRGRYRVLSALPRLHRYRRERGPRRVWQAPDRALLHANARLTPLHTYAFPRDLTINGGPDGGELRLDGLRFENGAWREGLVECNLWFGESLHFSGNHLEKIRGGALTLEGGFVNGDPGKSTLDLTGRLSWVSAQLSAREETLAATLPHAGVRANARLTLDPNHRERGGTSPQHHTFSPWLVLQSGQHGETKQHIEDHGQLQGSLDAKAGQAHHAREHRPKHGPGGIDRQDQANAFPNAFQVWQENFGCGGEGDSLQDGRGKHHRRTKQEHAQLVDGEGFRITGQMRRNAVEGERQACVQRQTQQNHESNPNFSKSKNRGVAGGFFSPAQHPDRKSVV